MQKVREYTRATAIQALARQRSTRKGFKAKRSAALTLQSYRRMRVQRRQYQKDLAEKKEEAKLSTQLAKMQARMEAEIAARKAAEQEQERLKQEAANAPAQAAGGRRGGGLAQTRDHDTVGRDAKSCGEEAAVELQGA